MTEEPQEREEVEGYTLVDRATEAGMHHPYPTWNLLTSLQGISMTNTLFQANLTHFSETLPYQMNTTSENTSQTVPSWVADLTQNARDLASILLLLLAIASHAYPTPSPDAGETDLVLDRSSQSLPT